jgi:acyl-homoserine-lactone acylase
MRFRALVLSCTTNALVCHAVIAQAPIPELARQVEIRRTTWGVPQIHAENLAAAGFALAWVMLEDHGTGTIEGMEAARGRMAMVRGRRAVDGDARAILRHRIATREWVSISEGARQMYDGFAAGMNHYIRSHADSLPEWMTPDFSGVDVLARDVQAPSTALVERFRRRIEAAGDRPPLLVRRADSTWGYSGVWVDGIPIAPPSEDNEGEPVDNVGSNAWAIAPSRTARGHAILLRNPHLSWSAG